MKFARDKVKVGTKSVLFGVHQFIWHPLTVFRAWKELYGWPTWKELVCIMIHDIGYFGKEDIDRENGFYHPVLGARLAHNWLGDTYADLCVFHSRSFAVVFEKEPSRLCWADKLSIKYDPEWFYLFRAFISGEINEYRMAAAALGKISLLKSNHEWFLWAAARSIDAGYNKIKTPAYEVEK